MIASIHACFPESQCAGESPAGPSSVCTDSQRRELIEQHLPMVAKIVSRTVGRGPCRRDLDEYVSAGHLGLVQAARTFDPSLGANFGVYAYNRIRGAVLDEMRHRCFLPVSAYRRLQRYQRTQADLTRQQQRPPSDEELADALHTTAEEVRQMQHLQQGAQYVADDDMDILPRIPSQTSRPDEIVQNRENVQRLTEAIKRLPHQYRAVLHLYYLRGKKMKTIARRLGLTESRISQICARAVELLRDMMNETSQPHTKAA